MMSLRPAARRLRQTALRLKSSVLRRVGLAGGEWAGALPEEANFWEGALRDGGAAWNPEAFRFRMDPASLFQPELQALIPAPEGAKVRVLDVGAGPLTTLGKQWPGRTLEIVATDPLAAEYDRMLARLQLVPPVRTVDAVAEQLDAQFAAESFDLAYSSNALDHSRDPFAALHQMLRTVKPGGHVYLWHFANEGLEEGYQGLHQWNFDVQHGDFLIGDGRRQHSVSALFAGMASLTCEETVAFGKRVVIARLRKLAA